MISENRVQEALKRLAESDEPAAQAKANMLRLEKTEKTILGVVFLESVGTNGEREYKARTSENYRQWQEDYANAVLEYETLRNKRTKEELVIEVWRSLNANRRHGNI